MTRVSSDTITTPEADPASGNTIEHDGSSAVADPFSILTTPGGKEKLRRDGDTLIARDGSTFRIEKGIVRMLESIDPALAAELAAQDAAREIYLDDRLLVMRYERKLAQVLVEQMLDGVRGRILDAGCGVGLLGSMYPELGLYSVDASFTLLTEATNGYDLRVECSVERLPFEDESFDVVLALNMLHHVISPERAIQEFARILKPKGLLLALDPRKAGFVELGKSILRKTDEAFAQTHNAFSLEEYRQLVRSSESFDIEEMRCSGLVAPIGVGVLERFRSVSRYLPAPDAALASLMWTDRALSLLAKLLPAGLNMFVRARRR